MHILLVRHGESWANLPASAGSFPDGDLTPRGRRQAERLGERLRAWRPTMLRSSTLARARETMAIVADACAIPVGFDDRLREVGTCWPDRTPVVSEDLPREWPPGAPSTRPRAPAWGASECWLEFVARVGCFVEEMAAGSPDERVVAVTHSGFVDAFCDFAFGAGVPRRVEVACGHASITHWEHRRREPEPWLLHGLNLCDHLDPGDVTASLAQVAR